MGGLGPPPRLIMPVATRGAAVRGPAVVGMPISSRSHGASPRSALKTGGGGGLAKPADVPAKPAAVPNLAGSVGAATAGSGHGAGAAAAVPGLGGSSSSYGGSSSTFGGGSSFHEGEISAIGDRSGLSSSHHIATIPSSSESRSEHTCARPCSVSTSSGRSYFAVSAQALPPCRCASQSFGKFWRRVSANSVGSSSCTSSRLCAATHFRSS
mmetsp:Transcript_110803/g.238522  ORF Transcript_110803/g.238522 Transcript_110803/m.238522 type:complete len:211 (-) Transcript_110803:1047-1679(-)